MEFTHHFTYRGYQFALTAVESAGAHADVICRCVSHPGHEEEYDPILIDKWLLGVLLNIRQNAWDWVDEKEGPMPEPILPVTLASVFEELNAR